MVRIINMFVLALLLPSSSVFAQVYTELEKIIEKGDNPRFMKIRKGVNITAKEFISKYKSELGLGDKDELVLEKEEVDDLGYRHYCYRQYYDNVPVFGGEFNLHEKNDLLYLANGTIVKGIKADKKNVLANELASRNANSAVNSDGSALDRSLRNSIFKKENTIYNGFEVVYDKSVNQYVLAYKFIVESVDLFQTYAVYINAEYGSFICKYALSCNLGGIGSAFTKYNGEREIITTKLSSNQYALLDNTRGGGIETLNMRNQTIDKYLQADSFFDDDNAWDNFNANQDEIATDIHWGMETTYDYFLQKHARNSFDNNGGKIYAYAHTHIPADYDINAKWDPIRRIFYFGDGNQKTKIRFEPITTLDIIAHEFTHGVTYNEANLVYQGESGALNESFSDIFGAAVEFFVKGANANWKIAEGIYSDEPYRPLRSMSDPHSTGGPETYLEKGKWKDTNNIQDDLGGVHTNSSVHNYWFYLLSSGGGGVNDNNNKYSVKGIGIEKATKIAYRSLSIYLTSNANFDDARTFSLQAAADLFNTQDNPCSSEYLQTLNAWYAVGLGNPGMMIDKIVVQDPTCGLADGTVDVSVKNVVSNNNVTYLWNDGNTSPVRDALAAGIYTITVTDGSNHCRVDTTIIVRESKSFTLSAGKTDVLSCDDNSGIAIAIPTGIVGVALYAWSNGASASYIEGLSEGVYYITVTDTSTMCMVIDSVKIEGLSDPEVIISGGGVRTFCQSNPDKSIVLTATASNCSNCTFTWSTGTIGNSLIVDSKGTYSVIATDPEGCSGGDVASVEIYLRDCDICNTISPPIKFQGTSECKEWQIPILRAVDPNELIAPAGYGDEHWVSATAALPYKVLFENDPDFATAAAQKVVIKVPLDPEMNHFSLRLGEFGFGDFAFPVPDNAAFYQNRLDLRDSLGLFVDVTAGLDVTRKEAFWIFQSVDPATNLPSTLPAGVGFLPVNDSLTHRGEGYVTFTVRPAAGVVTGDTITAQASIVFDIEAPLATNVETNLLDAFPPVSSINSLPPMVDTNCITLDFSAQDDPGGAGVAVFDLYVAQDSGAFFLYQANIDTNVFLFCGSLGSTYQFYTRATDYVGNEEPPKSIADVTVMLGDNHVAVSAKVLLQGPYVAGVQLMHDSLRVQNRILLTEPYTGLSGFSHTGGGGGEQTTTAVLAVNGPDAIVDWIFLELRDESTPEQVLATRSALLQRDGDVVDVDGVSPVRFASTLDPGYYALAVRHRNHLGVQLGATKFHPLGMAVATDFTILPPEGFYAYNGLNPAQKLIGGKYALWAGNGRVDSQLKYNGSNNDRTSILSVVGLATPNAVVPGYLLADYNLDGVVKYNGSANDRNVLLGNVGIATPSAVVWDQTSR